MSHRYIKELEKGLSVPSMMYTYSPGGSVMNHVFVWRVADDFSVEAALSVNQQVVANIMDGLPVYHSLPHQGYEERVHESLWTSYARSKALCSVVYSIA